MGEKVTTIAIVLAAGRGKRMKSETAKQYLLLGGKPMLYYSLKTFQESRLDHIILVTSPEDHEYVRREIVEKYDFSKVKGIVAGGKERYHSVYNGLQQAKKYAAGQSYVFIHDGARPFVTEEILERAFDAVKEHDACVVGMPVKDTIKIADKSGFAVNTPNRSLVWLIQTPQIFEFSLIVQAYEELIAKEEELFKAGIQVTDDACVVELFTDQRVKLVEGTYENIKITTPEDLKVAEQFLKEIFGDEKK